ncbi:MAG: hypothetical protein E6J14_04095 [Chloroflexi bacterium]|nr:MAG: hypothetical protein E6J14_04095 [Chloroflexota bacterium]
MHLGGRVPAALATALLLAACGGGAAVAPQGGARSGTGATSSATLPGAASASAPGQAPGRAATPSARAADGGVPGNRGAAAGGAASAATAAASGVYPVDIEGSETGPKGSSPPPGRTAITYDAPAAAAGGTEQVDHIPQSSGGSADFSNLTTADGTVELLSLRRNGPSGQFVLNPSPPAVLIPGQLRPGSTFQGSFTYQGGSGTYSGQVVAPKTVSIGGQPVSTWQLSGRFDFAGTAMGVAYRGSLVFQEADWSPALHLAVFTHSTSSFATALGAYTSDITATFLSTRPR